MPVATLRARLTELAGKPTVPAVLCITGASGVGKTATLRALRERIEARVLPALEFDSLGVPSQDEMHAAWDSPRGWQKAMTYHWVYTAKHVYRTHPLVVIEGQFDPQYAIAACSAHRLRFAVILLHTDDAVRSQRLAQRGKSELAPSTVVPGATPGTGADEMATWASYLHESAQQLGGVVVDASPAIDHVVDALCVHALPLLEPREEDTRDPRERMRAKRIN